MPKAFSPYESMWPLVTATLDLGRGGRVRSRAARTQPAPAVQGTGVGSAAWHGARRPQTRYVRNDDHDGGRSSGDGARAAEASLPHVVACSAQASHVLAACATVSPGTPRNSVKPEPHELAWACDPAAGGGRRHRQRCHAVHAGTAGDHL